MPKRNSNGWSVPLTQVIAVKGGQKLVTLADARTFILKRPKRQHSAQWDGAIRCLLQAAETSSAADIKQATLQIERSSISESPPMRVSSARALLPTYPDR